MSALKTFFDEPTGQVFVFSTSYTRAIAHLNACAAVIKGDFPDATDDDIESAEFDNPHNKGILAARYRVADPARVPPHYQRMGRSDYLRCRR